MKHYDNIVDIARKL